jgi:hypothetical protein
MNEKDRDHGSGGRTGRLARRRSVARRLGMAAALALTLTTRAADAQECDASRGVLFIFDGSTPFVSATVKGLTPKSSVKYTGRGTLQLDNGSTIPVEVSATGRTTRVLYKLKAREPDGTRVKAKIDTDGCLAEILKLSVSARGPNMKTVFRDPWLVAIAGVVARGVVIVDGSDVGAVSAASANDPSGTIRIASTGPLAAEMQPGRIVLAAATPATPNGMVGVVTGISSDGVTTAVSTGPARLEDAFEFLDVEIGSDGVSTASMGKPRIAFDNSVGAAWSEDFSFRITENIEQWAAIPGVSVRVGGRLEIDTNLYARVKIGLNPGLKTVVSGRVETAAFLESSGSFSVSKDIDLVGPIRFAAFTIGPVTFVPEISLVAGIEGGFGGDLWAEAHAGVDDIRIGFDCNWDWDLTGGHWNCDGIREGDPFAWGNMVVSSQGFVNASTGVQLALMVQGIAGPYVSPNFFLEAAGNPNQQPRWILSGGFAVDAGVTIDIGPFDINFDIDPLVLVKRELNRAPNDPPPLYRTCPHAADAGAYGTLWRCWEKWEGFSRLGYYSHRNGGSFTIAIDWLQIRDDLGAPPSRVQSEGDLFFNYVGGPFVQTPGFGPVSYGQQQWPDSPYGPLVRWGAYTPPVPPAQYGLFHPDGGWREDRGPAPSVYLDLD